MSTAVQFRRGTATEHESFTGLEGEITVDTTNDTLRVHDGSTVGGFRLAKYSEIIDPSNITAHLIPATADTYDLGTPSKPWRRLYVSANSVVVGNVTLSSANGSMFIDNELIVTANNTSFSGNTTISNLTVTGNTSLTSLVLTNVLGVSYGGTGRTSFIQNGVAIGANSSVMGFVTGTSGQVFQVASNGTPTFDKLDGGSF